jgi:hypothetical protein
MFLIKATFRKFIIFPSSGDRWEVEVARVGDTTEYGFVLPTARLKTEEELTFETS